jgi:hypothetical protein
VIGFFVDGFLVVGFFVVGFFVVGFVVGELPFDGFLLGLLFGFFVCTAGFLIGATGALVKFPTVAIGDDDVGSFKGIDVGFLVL